MAAWFRVRRSEANLAPLGSGTVEHARFAFALRRIGYGHWGSVEMRSIAHDTDRSKLRAALSAARDFYGDTPAA